VCREQKEEEVGVVRGEGGVNGGGSVGKVD